MSKRRTKKMDGAQLAILTNRFEGIARKMANTLMRTGRSGVLNRAKDFSCCIVTKDCQFLAAAESLPIHVLSGPDLMAGAMMEMHPVLRAGDAFLNNSPYHGCSHAADHTILVPVVDEDGIHHFTVLAKAHQADIGNSLPTTYHAGARDVYEEGALIFPSTRVARDYEIESDIVRMCEMRIRVPEQWYGDFLAMMGAARIGEREVLALGREVGWDHLHAFTDVWFDYSESRMVEAIGKLSAGAVTKSSTHDAIPGTPEGGIKINATVMVKPEQARIAVDLTDNIDALPCGLNVSEACTRTAAMIGVFNSIDHTVPKNAGSFRRIDLKLKENGVVGIPRHPTSCSVATTNVADHITNSVQGAIAEISENAGMAEVGSIMVPSLSVISGLDPRTGKPYVNQVFLGFTGGGGVHGTDVWITQLHAGNAGMCYIDSVELDELFHPILVRSRGLRTDSEGSGEFRGAPAFHCIFGPVGGTMDVVYISDGVVNKPQGVRGGLTGHGSEQYLIKANGKRETLPGWARLSVQDGEFLETLSCGGGGYGDPLNRDPARVARDAQEDWISVERARDVYGVVLNPDSTVDEDATAALRADRAVAA